MAVGSGGAVAPGTSFGGGGKRPRKRPGKRPGQKVKGGIAKRAQQRYKALGGVSGVKLGDGVTRREARKVRRSWIAEGKPRPWRNKGGGGGGGGGGGAGEGILSRQQNRQIDRLADLEYGADERLLNRELAREGRHTQTIGQAFQQYKTTVDGLISAQSQATADAMAQLNAAQGAAQGAVNSMGEAAASQVGERAKLLGFGGEGQAAVQGANQAAQASASQQAAGNVAALGAQGLNATGQLTTRAAIAPREQIQQLNAGRTRARELEGKRTELQRDKRNYRTKLRDSASQRAQEQYVAILSVQQKAMSDKQDRQLRLRLGLIDAKQAAAERRAEARENAAERAHEKGMNDADNATSRANAGAGGSGGGSGGGGGGRGGKGLSPSDKREWNKTKSKYASLASAYRRNLRKYSKEGAWAATARQHGGRLSHMDLVAATWIASNKRIPRDVRQYLNSKFPGGRSPWS